MSSRAGSHAGRGFRYQDVAATHLMVMGFVGRYPYGMVTPEGRDDLELREPEFRVLCQVKSRRDHMGPFSAKAVAGFTKKMWDSKARNATDRFLLVLESDVGERSSSQSSLRGLNSYPSVIAELKGKKGLAADALNTQVLVLPSPRADAMVEIANALGCSQQEADVYFADLLGLVGAAADTNGMRKPADYLGVGVSDVQQRFDALQPVLTSAVVEEALATGLCTAVDFFTANDDYLFFMGVDAQPAHVAAGLVVERPELRAAVMDGLHDRRNVLVHGPSGSGKSAILWDSAYASRHAVRWFQIRRLPSDALSCLVRLAHSRRASLDAPVGFIIDDVGRGFTEAWAALAAEVHRTPGLLLLSSVREEDRYPLVGKAHARQVRVDSDIVLAERIWSELRHRGQTDWKGWKEPWSRSSGHLLEYTHVLTQGRRLSETLSEQVAVRLNDVGRHDELDVLRVVSCANAAGCSAEVVRLPGVLGKQSSTVSVALSRLVNEHLVNDSGEGRIVGLHELRSGELLRLTHEFPPPVLSTTAAAAVRVVPASELARFLERTLSAHVSSDDPVLYALVQRIQAEPSASVFAAVMKGLDLAHAHRVVQEWLATPEAQTVPRAQRGLAGMLGLTGVELPEIGQEVQFGPACRRIGALRAAAAPTSLPQRCIALLGPVGMRRVAGAARDVRELAQVLASLGGQELPETILVEFSRLNPAMQDGNFDDVVALLRAAHALSHTVAVDWVSRVGQEILFQRFVDSMSWVSAPTLAPCDEGVEVRADVWCITALMSADANEAVVGVCEVLLAVTPSADVVASDALGGDGQLQMMTAEYPLVQKRILRENLPGPAIVNRNRGWMLALNSQLAMDSSTAYLSQCLEHLRVINRNLKLLLDSVLRGPPDGEALAVLGRVNDASRALVPPPEVGADGTESRRSSKLQSLLFDCSANVIRRFLQLPEGASAFLGWVDDLLSHVKSAEIEEPWELLASEPPKELGELSRILEGLRALAGEASVRQRSPFATHGNPKAKKGSVFDTACRSARQFHDVQLAKLESALRAQLCSDENGYQVFLLRYAAIPVVWPPSDVLITVPAETSADIATSWATWRAAIEGGRRICVLPVVEGYGLTTFAVAGFDTPNAVRDEANKWCTLTGVQPLPLINVDAFTAITNPLSELDAIRTYWANKDGHTPLEQATYDEHMSALALSRTAFQALNIPAEVTSAVNQFVDLVLAGELSLAAEASRVVTGEIGPTWQLVGELLRAVIAADISLATSRLVESAGSLT